MMNLDFIRGLQIIIIAFLSYIITVTFTGWFESFVAKQMGDDTPEDLGFLSLNPLDHFNVFGFAAVLWNLFYGHLLPFGIIPAWGRYIPLLPETMHGKNLKLRAFIEFIGRSMGNLIILIAVTFISAAYGLFNIHTYESIKVMTTNPSSFVASMWNLLLFIYYQNLMLFVFHFILGVFKYVMHFYVPRFQELSMQKIIMGCIILSLGIFIFQPVLTGFVYIIINLVQSLILKMGLL
jgi:hypothetical protein